MSSKILLFALSLVLVSGIGACRQFSINDANKMQRGMSQEQALELASKAPRETYTNASKDFQVQVYAFSLGDYKCDYLLAFRGNKLFYWGYPYEFLRNSDPAIVEIGKWAVDQIEK